MGEGGVWDTDALSSERAGTRYGKEGAGCVGTKLVTEPLRTSLGLLQNRRKKSVWSQSLCD